MFNPLGGTFSMLGNLNPLGKKKKKKRSIDSYSPTELSQRWDIFRLKFAQNQQIQDHIKDEVNLLSHSVMNAEGMFHQEDENIGKDLIISYKDLLVKFLAFI